MLRVNVGCGPTPFPGWVNVDNSPSLVLARLPRVATSLLERLGLVGPAQSRMVAAGRTGLIRRARADALPFPDGSVALVYSSHMLEHLGRVEAAGFLAECRRVLTPAGGLRLVVPDLERHVRAYESGGDADRFVESLHLAQPVGGSALSRVVVGFRGHRWMYDARSLTRLVEHAGFDDVRILEPGETGFEDVAGLDLREREVDSLYLEARNPPGG